MSGTLFGYYDLGLRALSAAQFGLQVAGNNISNVNTPGYSKRRIDLVPGMPQQVKGGMLDRGVEIGAIRVSKIENKGKRNRRVNIVFAD